MTATKLRSTSADFASIPGPRGLPFLGNLLPYVRDPMQFIASSVEEYGDVVRLRFPGAPTLLIVHPDDIEYVLVTAQHNFTKARDLQSLAAVIGNGLLLSEGDYWQHQHTLIRPAFSSVETARYTNFIVDRTRSVLDAWSPDKPVDLFDQLSRISLASVGHLLFKDDLNEHHEAVLDSLNAIMEYFLGVAGTGLRFPAAVPTPGNRRFRRALRALDSIIEQLIADETRTRGGGLLTHLKSSVGANGSPMSSREVRDELVTLLLTGLETAALAATYACYLIAKHPEVATRLESEVDAVLNGQPADEGSLQSLEYTKCIVLEAMRLFPPAWALGREAREDCQIGGYGIPAGTQIFIGQWLTHLDPRWFDAPNKFEPERWSRDVSASLPKFAYFPFGGGVRKCIGYHFAMRETILMIATIAQRFHLRPSGSLNLKLHATVTLRPKHSIKILPVPRSLEATRARA